jgi:hypothetical protein
MSSRFSLLSRVVSNLSSKQGKRTLTMGRILIVLVTIFMVMSGGEPAYAGWCSKC